MIYVNLILRNLRRSVKEYVVYMTTLSISIMLIYAFNGLIYSEQMQLLSDRISTFAATILLVTILIVLVIGWLIYYISNFILQKRSKEFGMYLLMGMTRRQVSLMFLTEQIFLAMIAFVIGCFLGTFAIQIMLMIIVNMFQQPYLLSIDFSMQSVGITGLFFIGIFILEFAREYHSLMKHKIYDLLYSDKRNETVKKNRALSYICCFLAIACFIVGYYYLDKFMNAMLTNSDIGGMYFLICVPSFVVSIYLWFYGLSSFVTRYINKRKKLKYHGNTMYMYGQISGRLRSNRIVLATLSILTLLTLLFVCIGCKFTEVQDKGINQYAPFDISAFGGTELDVSSIQAFLTSQDVAYQENVATTYKIPTIDFSLFESVSKKLDYFKPEDGTFISLSDYNALRKFKGVEEIAMNDKEYIVLINQSYENRLQDALVQHTLVIDGNSLSLNRIDAEGLGQGNMDIINVVIPDAYIHYGTPVAKTYNVKTETTSTTQWAQAFEETFKADNERVKMELYYPYVNVKADLVMGATFSTLLINLCLYYFAIIFTCISATILATQQLSDSMKQRYSYSMLWRMGVSKKELFALMRKQIAMYFFVPMILPFLYAIPILYSIGNLFEQTYADESIFPYFFISVIFYLGINIGYYLLAYFGCKQNIKESL